MSEDGCGLEELWGEQNEDLRRQEEFLTIKRDDVLAVVEGWISEADFDLDGNGLGVDPYLWLWRELPPELGKMRGGFRPVTVTIARKP